MKIQKIFYLLYFLRETKFCLTAIKSFIKDALMALKAKDFNASTYNSDKNRPLQKKAVEEKNCIICMGCKYFDWWNGECIQDEKTKTMKF